MKSFTQLGNQFEEYLSTYQLPDNPSQLYEPLNYILAIGGKRIRPKLVLAAYNLYKEDVSFAFEAAMTVEFFHNFSLLHDDIMDDADLRRGKPSVHIKYDINSAILSGDVMLIYAYKFLEKYTGHNLKLFSLTTKTSIEVCEGQRMDMDFETRNDVAIEDYIRMIELKTSVLIGGALQMGAIIGGASEADQQHIYEFGRNIGIAFQIQDDLLDTFGTEALVGKKIGGDIRQKKKTYLYLKSLELLSASQTNRLKELYAVDGKMITEDQVEEVTALFRAAHVDVHCEELKLVYQQLAFSHLDTVSVSEDKKSVLRTFAEVLMGRES
jgi:geranylgeranyl diphosphate synthase type II